MDYDAIVIGSGFGGSVATTMLTSTGKKVLVLERGGWWVSASRLGKPPKPVTMADWLKQMQADLKAKGKQADELVHYWPRPDHEKGLIDLVASIRTRFNPNGLFNYSRFEEAHIPTANGVGGGSLIYSNVTLRPDDEVLRHIGLDLDQGHFDLAAKWMKHFRGPTSKIVTKIPFVLSDAERAALDIGPLDDLDPAHDYLYLDKTRAMKNAATAVAAKTGRPLRWQPVDLSIVEYDPKPMQRQPDGTLAPTGAADKNHTHCERQGRCLFGCLPQARHTLNKTLYSKVLTDPKLGQFATLKALAEVKLIRRIEGGYSVSYRDQVESGREFEATAPNVFLAAGVLGTTELLLRCRDAGTLELSETLGHGFSTNGDFGGFAILPDNVDPIYSSRGPIQTGHIPVRLEADGQVTHITIEDSGLPAIVAELASIGLKILNAYIHETRRFARWWAGVRRLLFKWRLRWLFWHVGRHLHRLHWRLPHLLPRPKKKPRKTKTAAPQGPQFTGEPLELIPDTTDPHRYQTEAEMVARIFFFNSMGQDDASGRFHLKRGKLDLTWDKPITSHPIYRQIEGLQRELATAMGGTYLSMPLWEGFAEKKLIIPHPLGGCRIGASRHEGVVDAFGRVFDGNASTEPNAVLPGLYVVDGSTIPGALAVNPTLTITAQALKTMGSIFPLDPIVTSWGA
jgi:choline dehydrogenase-like flavoprotein